MNDIARVKANATEHPVEFDLRVRGMELPMTDQATCGSCYAFAAAAVLEGRINLNLKRTNEPLVKVSE